MTRETAACWRSRRRRPSTTGRWRTSKRWARPPGPPGPLPPGAPPQAGAQGSGDGRGAGPLRFAPLPPALQSSPSPVLGPQAPRRLWAPPRPVSWEVWVLRHLRFSPHQGVPSTHSVTVRRQPAGTQAAPVPGCSSRTGITVSLHPSILKPPPPTPHHPSVPSRPPASVIWTEVLSCARERTRRRTSGGQPKM